MPTAPALQQDRQAVPCVKHIPARPCPAAKISLVRILFSPMDLSSFFHTATVEGHTRREAGPQSHGSHGPPREGWVT